MVKFREPDLADEIGLIYLPIHTKKYISTYEVAIYPTFKMCADLTVTSDSARSNIVPWCSHFASGGIVVYLCLPVTSWDGWDRIYHVCLRCII